MDEIMSHLDEFRRIANDPGVLPFIAPGRPSVNTDHYFRSPGNVVVRDSDGAVLFVALADDWYEGHFLYTKRKRGRAALHFSRHALRVLFDERGAKGVIGVVDVRNKSARYMSRAIGCKPRGRSVDYYGRSCIEYVLERASWEASLEALSRASAA
jgi:hypothetical protein